MSKSFKKQVLSTLWLILAVFVVSTVGCLLAKEENWVICSAVYTILFVAGLSVSQVMSKNKLSNIYTLLLEIGIASFISLILGLLCIMFIPSWVSKIFWSTVFIFGGTLIVFTRWKRN